MTKYKIVEISVEEGEPFEIPDNAENIVYMITSKAWSKDVHEISYMVPVEEEGGFKGTKLSNSP